jgi:hypothetical protein
MGLSADARQPHIVLHILKRRAISAASTDFDTTIKGVGTK